MNPEVPMKKKHLRKHKDKLDPGLMNGFRGYPGSDYMYPPYGMNPAMGDAAFMSNFDPAYLDPMAPDYMDFEDYPMDFEGYPDFLPDKDSSDYFRNANLLDPSSKISSFPSPNTMDKMKTYKKLAPIKKSKPSELETSCGINENKKLGSNKKKKFDFYENQIANLHSSLKKDDKLQNGFGKKIPVNLKESKLKEFDKEFSKEEQEDNSDWQDMGNSISCSVEEDSSDQKESEEKNVNLLTEDRFAKKNLQVFDASEFMSEVNDDLSTMGKFSYHETSEEDELDTKSNEEVMKTKNKKISDLVPQKEHTDKNEFVFGALAEMIKNNKINVKNNYSVSKNKDMSKIDDNVKILDNSKDNNEESYQKIEPTNLMEDQNTSSKTKTLKINEQRQNSDDVVPAKKSLDCKTKHENEDETGKKSQEIPNMNYPIQKNVESRGDDLAQKLYENKIENLKAQLDLQLGEKDNMEAKYQNMLTTLNMAKEKLEKDLELAQSRYVHLETKWKFECDLTSKLKKNHDAEKEKYEMAIENERQKAEKEADKFRKTISKLREDLQANNDQKEQIQIENQSLNKRILLLDELSKNKKDENIIPHLNTEIKELKTLLDKANKDKEKLQNANKDFENKILKIEKLSSMEQNLMIELKQLQEEKDDLTKKAQHAIYDNQRLSEENINLQNKVHRLNTELELSTEKNTQDQIKCKELINKNEELNKKILELSGKSIQKEIMINTDKLFQDNIEEQGKFEEEINLVRKELKMKDEYINDLKLKLEQQSKQIEYLTQMSDSKITTETGESNKIIQNDNPYNVIFEQKVIQTLDQFKIQMANYEKELRDIKKELNENSARKFQNKNEDPETVISNYVQNRKFAPTNVNETSRNDYIDVCTQFVKERENSSSIIKNGIFSGENSEKVDIFYDNNSFPKFPNYSQAFSKSDLPALKVDVQNKVERLKKHLEITKRQIMNIKV